MSFFRRVLSLFGGGDKPAPRESAPQVLAIAEEQRRSGQVGEAIGTLERALSTAPGNVGLHVSLGRMYLAAERHAEAVTAFESALRLDRENLAAIRQLAETHLRKGDKVEAIKKLKLYRGLKSGDREVEELIEKLARELRPTNPVPVPAAAAAEAMTSEGGPVAAVVSTPTLGAETRDATTAPVSAPEGALSRGAASAEPPSGAASRTESPLPAPSVPLGALGAAGAGAAAEPFATRMVPAVEGRGAGASAETGSSDDSYARDSALAVPDSGPGAAPYHDAARSSTESEWFPSRLAPETGARAEGTPFSAPSSSATAPAPAAAGAAARESAPGEAPAPGITETLADLYREQGYLAEARAGYEGLAASEGDPARRQAFEEKAAEVAAGSGRLATPEARLRAWLSRVPARAPARVDDLQGLLGELVERAEGVTAAALTDLEGLPVVTAGRDSGHPELEVLIAELTAFWKSVGRIDGDVGAGVLDGLAITGASGGAIVSSVTPDYALILRLAPGAPLGRIRYEASRAAWLLKPALG